MWRTQPGSSTRMSRRGLPMPRCIEHLHAIVEEHAIPFLVSICSYREISAETLPAGMEG